MSRRAACEPPPVEIDGAAFGLAQVVAGMFRMAAAKRPQLAARLRGSLAFQGTDSEFGVTVHFERERIRVKGSADRDASVLIEGPMMTLTKLAAGDTEMRAYLRREIRLHGMLRHPLLLMRTRRLLGAL